jgi:membrane-bound serine protease (ClpP class)
MLFDSPELGFRVSWWVIAPTVGATAGLFLFVLAYGVRALARRPMLGAAGLIGEIGVARGALAPEGQVAVHGELWRAIATGAPVDDGTSVRVVGVNGLTLTVVRSDARDEGGRP